MGREKSVGRRLVSTRSGLVVLQTVQWGDREPRDWNQQLLRHRPD